MNFPIKVQVIRSSGQKPRFYVSIPTALASAIGIHAGEHVEWELLSRSELHLVRDHPPPTRARKAPRK